MIQTPEFHKLVVLSTGHLTAATAKMLEEKPNPDWPFAGGRYADYGWFVYAHDEDAGAEDHRIPEDLFSIMTWARRHGAAYVLLNCDGDRIEALPWFAE